MKTLSFLSLHWAETGQPLVPTELVASLSVVFIITVMSVAIHAVNRFVIVVPANLLNPLSPINPSPPTVLGTISTLPTPEPPTELSPPASSRSKALLLQLFRHYPILESLCPYLHGHDFENLLLSSSEIQETIEITLGGGPIGSKAAKWTCGGRDTKKLGCWQCHRPMCQVCVCVCGLLGLRRLGKV